MEKETTRCVDSEAYDVVDFEYQEVDQHGRQSQDSGQILEDFVVLQEDEKIIATSSPIDGADEGLNDLLFWFTLIRSTSIKNG